MNEELFEKYLRGALTDEEALRLKELLEDPAEARRFAEFVQEWTLFAEVSRRMEAVTSAESATPRTGTARVTRVHSSAPAAWGVWAAGLAAVILLAAGIAYLTRPAPPNVKPTPLADLPAPAPTVPTPAPPPRETPPAPPDPPVVPAPAPPKPEVPTPVPAPPKPEPPAPTPRPPLPAPAPEPRTPGPRVAEVVAIASLERVEGDAQVVTRQGRVPARPGMSVVAEQGVQVSGKGLAVLRYVDGTRFELGADTAVERLTPRSVPLTRGTVAATVGPQAPGAPLVFATPHAEATVLGTRLTLVVASASTRLEVREGKVRLRRLDDSASVDVTAGHFAVVEKGVRLESRLLLLTAEFQDGVAGYAGTQDTSLSEGEPSRVFGAADELEADGDESGGTNIWALLRWDLSSIPPGATIQDAAITLHVTGTSLSLGYQLYEVKRSWTESDASWSRPWRVPGLRPPADRGAQALGTIVPRQKGGAAILLDTSVVQNWVRVPGSNHGVIIANDTSSDGFRFNSREYKDPLRRPKLTVRYTLGK